MSEAHGFFCRWENFLLLNLLRWTMGLGKVKFQDEVWSQLTSHHYVTTTHHSPLPTCWASNSPFSSRAKSSFRRALHLDMLAAAGNSQNHRSGPPLKPNQWCWFATKNPWRTTAENCRPFKKTKHLSKSCYMIYNVYVYVNVKTVMISLIWSVLTVCRQVFPWFFDLKLFWLQSDTIDTNMCYC